MTIHEDLLDVVTKVASPNLITEEASVWLVKSDSDPMVFYYVIHLLKDLWVCTCKGFRFTDGCKHLEKVRGT